MNSTSARTKNQSVTNRRDFLSNVFAAATITPLLAIAATAPTVAAAAAPPVKTVNEHELLTQTEINEFLDLIKTLINGETVCERAGALEQISLKIVNADKPTNISLSLALYMEAVVFQLAAFCNSVKSECRRRAWYAAASVKSSRVASGGGCGLAAAAGGCGARKSKTRRCQT